METVQLTERNVSDETLMLRVRDDGCRVAFAELFNRWSGRIHRLCYRMIGNYQDAEDLVQEVFGKLFRSRERYVAQSRFGAFLWKIAINQTRDFSRKDKRNKANRQAFLLSRQPPANNESSRDTEFADEVQQALTHLPTQYREVVVLRHFEGFQFSEIASLLGVPQGTVSSRMARGLRMLKQALNKSHDQPKK